MGVRSPLLKSYGDDFAWSLLDAAPDAMVIVAAPARSCSSTITPASCSGTRLEDLLGRVVEDLLPDGLRAVHRAHRTRYRAEPTVRAMGAGLELWARRSDGSQFPVEISLSPLRLGDDVFAVAAVRDITDRVEAEDQLHRVLHTLDATDDAVFIFDAATHAVLVRQRGRGPPGRLRPRRAADDDAAAPEPVHHRGRVPAPGPLPARRRPASSVMRQSVCCARTAARCPSRRRFRSAPTGRDGTNLVITLARDITARLEAEAELRESQDALREAEQVMAVAEDRERIAMDLHDTVIQRLFGEGLNLQAALGGVDDPDRTRARIESSIDGLDQTINELRSAMFSLQDTRPIALGLRGELLAIIAEGTDGLGIRAQPATGRPDRRPRPGHGRSVGAGATRGAVEHRPPRPRQPRQGHHQRRRTR